MAIWFFNVFYIFFTFTLQAVSALIHFRGIAKVIKMSTEDILHEFGDQKIRDQISGIIKLMEAQLLDYELEWKLAIFSSILTSQ